MRGWETKKLGEVCGYDKRRHDGSAAPYVGMEDIESHTGAFLGSTDAATVKSETFSFTQEHVLYGRLRPYLNKVLLPTFHGHCSTEIFPIKPTPAVDRRFLFYWLTRSETVNRINATCTGSRMPRAEMNEVLNFGLPVPPLPEQQRIVAILDGAFAGLDTMRAHTATNLQNARELFDSHLEETFSQMGDGWVETRLMELCDASRGITYGVIKLGMETPDGVPCLRTSNIKRLDLRLVGLKRISAPLADQYSRTILRGGEVLVNVRGTLGGVYVAPPAMTGWNVSREIAVAPILPDLILPEFAAFQIASRSCQGWLSNVSKGAAYVGINIEDLRSLPVWRPTLDRQAEIVEHIRELHSETQQLESLQRRKLSAIDELKQSILEQAFSGQLTAPIEIAA